MSVPSGNKYRNRPSVRRNRFIVILLLIIGAAVGSYLIYQAKHTREPQQKPVQSFVNPAIPAKQSLPQSVTAPLPVVSPPSGMEQQQSSQQSKPSESEKNIHVSGHTGRLAIIIDDMGSSMPEARALAAIKVPLTFSIIPGLRVDKDVASFAASNHIETMIHMPMQSKGWPSIRLEANGLLVSMSADDLEERVVGFIQRFPDAVGANNHMGSEFTEHEDKMISALQVLKKNNLFFIDSVTSPKSAGLRVAQRLGIKSARRNVFLDNEQQSGYILGQLNQAVRLARKNGSAIAICHPHPTTIATLTAALPKLADQGVQLVPVSSLTK